MKYILVLFLFSVIMGCSKDECYDCYLIEYTKKHEVCQDTALYNDDWMGFTLVDTIDDYTFCSEDEELDVRTALRVPRLFTKTGICDSSFNNVTFEQTIRLFCD
jgi:hypothetical protein